ncbi:hypothetical protein ACFMQL_32915 [Nonomuraea fastidiosa]|uniref:hypothetical protein n=1 Tax=Nonomuraea TaxID=83681 RepID=UPI00324861D1
MAGGLDAANADRPQSAIERDRLPCLPSGLDPLGHAGERDRLWLRPLILDLGGLRFMGLRFMDSTGLYVPLRVHGDVDAAVMAVWGPAAVSQ